jgi:hypothetical protein
MCPRPAKSCATVPLSLIPSKGRSVHKRRSGRRRRTHAHRRAKTGLPAPSFPVGARLGVIHQMPALGLPHTSLAALAPAHHFCHEEFWCSSSTEPYSRSAGSCDNGTSEHTREERILGAIYPGDHAAIVERDVWERGAGNGSVGLMCGAPGRMGLTRDPSASVKHAGLKNIRLGSS